MARRRNWYNDLARNTRDLNYLARVYGPKTPEEAVRRQSIGKRILLWIGIILALLVIGFFAILISAKESGPVDRTATAESRVRAQIGQVVPAVLTETPTRGAVHMSADGVRTATASPVPTAVPTATIPERLLIRYEEDGQCLIKGNINSKGAKIYHVPGSSSYNSTKIDTSQGEMWFCTEFDAIAAGWHAPGQ